MPTRFTQLFLLFISLLALTACGGAGSEEPAAGGDTPLQSQTISFSESGTIELQVGDVRTTSASAESAGVLTFSIEDTAVVAVDSNGTLTAVGAGSTQITVTAPADATYQRATLTLPITVVKRMADTRFETATLTLAATASHSTSATTDSDGALSYSSQDPNIASVTSDGRITAVSAGSTVIRAQSAETAAYLTGSAELTVTVTQLPQTLTLSYGSALSGTVDSQLTNTVASPGSGAFTYASSHPAIATVNGAGLVTLLSVGQATINVSQAADGQYTGATTSYQVTVHPIPATLSFAEPGPLARKVDDLLSNPASASTGAGVITYSVSDPSLASVDAAGNVILMAAGTVTVMASQPATDRHTAASASYVIDVSRHEQVLTFTRSGAQTLRVDDTLDNAVSGDLGTGSLSYSSADTAVASVDAAGSLTAAGAGTTTITATKAADHKYEAATASYSLTVERHPQTLTFAHAGDQTVLVDDTLDNAVSGDLGTGSLSYSSADTAVASVDAAGSLTAAGAGTTTITATKAADHKYEAATASYSLTVERHPQTLTFTHAGDQTVWVDDIFSNAVTGATGTGALSYTSDNTAIATVDADGSLLAEAAGTATITATISADRKYAQATASYLLTVDRHPQTIAFSTSGPLKMLTGQVQAPALTDGPGTGALSFSSSDTAIASVATNGEVTVHARGEATITATKAADEKYSAASASIELHAVDRQIAMTAWVGIDRARVQFNPAAQGIEWAASNTASCDMDDISACTNGTKRTIGALPEEEFSFAGHQTSYYQFRHGEHTASMPTQILRWSARSGLKTAALNGYLYLVGGSNYNTSSHINVWRSANGVQFTRQNAFESSTGSRQHHSVIGFNNKLWLIGGGSDASIWSSSNGASWTKEVASAPFGRRTHAQLLSLGSHLYLIGGDSQDGSTLKDVWRSADGISWTQITDGQAFAKHAHGLVFNGKLWLIGGDAGDGFGRALSSTDGISWTTVAATPPFDTGSGLGGAAAHDGKLWLVEGVSERTWHSTDGVDWQAGTPLPVTQLTNAAVQAFNGQLLIMGGNIDNPTAVSEHIYAHLGDSWGIVSDRHIGKPYSANLVAGDGILWSILQSTDDREGQMLASTDGVNWSARATPPGRKDGGRFAYFKGKLWLIQTDTRDGQRSHYYDASAGWISVDQVPAFSSRTFSFMVEHNGKLWVMGGNNTADNSKINDIWSSADGINWSLAGSNDILARSTYAVASFNGKLWVSGGQKGFTYPKDLHSSVDGSTWVKELDNVPYKHRTHATLWEQGGRLWLIGGWSNETFVHYSDVWSSADGVSWELEISNTLLGRRLLPRIVVLDGMAYLHVTSGADDTRTYGFWRSPNGKDWQRLMLQDAYLK